MLRIASIRAFSSASTSKKVLLLGLGGGPKPAGPPKGSGFTHEKLMAMLAQQNSELEKRGVSPTMLLLDSDAAPDKIANTVKDALAKDHYDVISIGAGVRTTESHFLLFENLVNLVHEHAPKARIAFDTGPGDKVESIFRNMR